VEGLKEALRIRENIAALQNELARISATAETPPPEGASAVTGTGKLPRQIGDHDGPNPSQNFLRRFEKEITAIAGVATALGIISGAIGLMLTSCQLSDTRKTFEAGTVYNLQKDGRELAWDIKKNSPEAYDYIFRYIATNNYPETTKSNSIPAIAKIIQFYSSVYNQHIDGVLSERYWPPFAAEICDVIRRPPIATYWTNKIVSGSFSPEFKQFGLNCLTNKSNH